MPKPFEPATYGPHAIKDCDLELCEPEAFARLVEASLAGKLTLQPYNDGWCLSQNPFQMVGHVMFERGLGYKGCIMFSAARLEVVVRKPGKSPNAPGKMLLMSLNPSETGDGKHAFVSLQCNGSFDPREWELTQRIVYIGPPSDPNATSDTEKWHDTWQHAAALLEGYADDPQ